MSDLVVRSVDDLRTLSQMLAISSLLPAPLRGKPADVGIIIMYGQELGLSPAQSLQGIYVVNGRPTLASQTWLALARKAGHRISIAPEDHDEQHCTVHLQRGDTGEKHVSTYTYAEAQAAKLAAKDVWQAHRKAMLLARAVSQGCRFLFPEIALGFYAEGELDEDPPVPITVERVEEPAEAEIVDDEAAADAILKMSEEFNFGGDAE